MIKKRTSRPSSSLNSLLQQTHSESSSPPIYVSPSPKHDFQHLKEAKKAKKGQNLFLESSENHQGISQEVFDVILKREINHEAMRMGAMEEEVEVVLTGMAPVYARGQGMDSFQMETEDPEKHMDEEEFGENGERSWKQMNRDVEPSQNGGDYQEPFLQETSDFQDKRRTKMALRDKTPEIGIESLGVFNGDQLGIYQITNKGSKMEEEEDGNNETLSFQVDTRPIFGKKPREISTTDAYVTNSDDFSMPMKGDVEREREKLLEVEEIDQEELELEAQIYRTNLPNCKLFISNFPLSACFFELLLFSLRLALFLCFHSFGLFLLNVNRNFHESFLFYSVVYFLKVIPIKCSWGV